MTQSTILIPLATPHNVAHSNGIRVFLELAMAAQKLGHEVILCPAINQDLVDYRIPVQYSSLRVSTDIPNGSIAILGDVISDIQYSFVRSRVDSVCHYAGAPYGLFSGRYGNPYRGLCDDLHAVHSPFVSTRFPCFYYQPTHSYLSTWLESSVHSGSHTVSSLKRRSLRVCIYSGKGHLSRLPDSLRRLINKQSSFLITRHWPATKNELRQAILMSDAVISFDPLTSLSFEASLLGRPCLSVADWDESIDVDSFPVCLDGIAFNDVSRFIHILESGFDYQSVLSSYRAAVLANPVVAENLINYALGLTQEAVISEIDASKYWEARKPFLSSLSLPSACVPSIKAALQSYHAEDVLEDVGRTFLWSAIPMLRAIKRAVLNRFAAIKTGGIWTR